MRKEKKFSLLIVLLLAIFTFNTSISGVYAETRYVKKSSKGLQHYGTSSSKAGEYTGGSGTPRTFPKSLCTNTALTKNCDKAYCIEGNDDTPVNKEKYIEYYKSEHTSLVAGRIIANIKNDIKDADEEYVLIYATLNTYINFKNSLDFSKNTKIKKYISEAKKEVEDEKTTTSLPNFNMSVTGVRRKGDEFIGTLKLTNLTEKSGGNAIAYYITASDNVSLPSSKINGDSSTKEIEFHAQVGYNTKISFNVNASNSSTYKYARFWKSAKDESGHQRLATQGSKTYSRQRTKSITYTTTDKKQLTLTKVREDNGNELTGANVTVTLSQNGKTIGNGCKTNGTSSCTIQEVSEDLKSVDYTITEESPAPGYVKNEKPITGTWNLSDNKETCQVQATSSSPAKDTDLVDCNRNYTSSTICKITDKKTNSVTYQDGECPKDETTGGSTPGGSTTGTDDNSNESTGDRSDTGATTPTTPTTPEQTTTKETLKDQCHYQDGDALKIADATKCVNKYIKITTINGNMQIQYSNTQNKISISKRGITGSDEVPGAELKICSNKPDDKGECNIVKNTVVGQCKSNATSETTDDSTDTSTDTSKTGTTTSQDKTTNDTTSEMLTGEFNCSYSKETGLKTLDMHWYSTSTAKQWNGIAPGTYYLVETTAPDGYVATTTSVPFTVDKDNKVTSTATKVENDTTVVLTNKETEMTISKTDVATSKELPGAEISICAAYKNENNEYKTINDNDGYCIPSTLADGTKAQWTSTDKPKTIKGLSAGTYYLVEKTAPKGYSTAESILFVMKSDGTLTDINGKSLANNKLVMYDAKIQDVKTGELPIVPIAIVGIGAVGIGGYFYLKSIKALPVAGKKISGKIRKRKIHK